MGSFKLQNYAEGCLSYFARAWKSKISEKHVRFSSTVGTSEPELARVEFAFIKNHLQFLQPQPRETLISVLLRELHLPLGTRPSAPVCFSPSFFLQQFTLFFNDCGENRKSVVLRL